MKLNTVTRDVVSSGTMEVSTAKIKATAKIFDMFADQTYANKPVAILRELVANGVDAHIAAGKPDTPVEITMPTEFDQMFKVKDSGTGMPHDFVMGPFMEYTNGSTKDQSNDQIGGFGIGSKSPFAYCDQFTLRVVHDGVLSVYTMFKNDEGIPAIGLQAQNTTDEPNGVEVSFPVELDDIEDFRSAAQSALQYFQPLPIVHNGELQAPAYTHIASSKKWAMKSSPDGTLGIIMGGVRYPVTQDALQYDIRNDKKLSPLLNYGIDLTLPIGACDVAMSREALSYTPRTNTALRQALNDIVDEVADTFAHLFDKAKTYWEAQVQLYNQLDAIGGHGYAARHNPRATMIKAYAKWKGKDLSLDTDLRITSKWDPVNRAYDKTYPQGYPKGATYWTPIKSSWRQGFPSTKFVDIENLYIQPGNYQLVIIDDMVIASKSRTAARVAELMTKLKMPHEQGKVIIFRAEKNEDKASIDALLKYLGSPQKVYYTSKLPEPARAVRQVVANGVQVPRPTVRMIKYNGDNDVYGNTISSLHPAHAKRRAVTELETKDQPTSGIVVVTENWVLEPEFRKKMLTGLVKWDDLVFVLKSDYQHIKDQFKTFDEVFDPLFTAYKAKYKDAGKFLWFKNRLGELTDPVDDIVEYHKKGWFNGIKRDKTKPFWELIGLLEKYGAALTNDVQTAIRVLDIKEKPMGADLKGLEARIRKEHPDAVSILNLMGNTYSRYDRKDMIPIIVKNL